MLGCNHPGMLGAQPQGSKSPVSRGDTCGGLDGASRGARLRIVVVGGGVAGLAAAHRLLELGAQRRIRVDAIVYEARCSLGGRIGTERAGGFLIERGPDAFLTNKPWARDLCARLGLTGSLIGPRPAPHSVYVAMAGRLHPLPEGFLLLAPTRIVPMLRSPLLSWRGKARMAMDLLLPRGPTQDDESLESFVTRRLGREVLERLAQPLAAATRAGDPEVLSLAATMPEFLELERRYRSVIRGMMRTRLGRGFGVTGPGNPTSPLMAPSGGMAELIDAIRRRLPGPAVRAGRQVRSILRAAESAPSTPGRYRIVLDDGTSLEADGVILATEAHRAAAIVADLDADLARLLGTIPYASLVSVTLAYRREQIARPVDGFGYLVPRSEGRPIMACTFTSRKFSGRAPADHALFRVFLRGDAGVVEQDDEALTALAHGELAEVQGVSGVPCLVRVHRHERAMPQYLVGHLSRVAAIEAHAARHRAFALAGAAYHGVGVPSCIRSGEEAAARVLEACLESAVRA